MFFLGHSGIILSLLLTLAFPFVFLFPGKQIVVNQNWQVGKVQVIDIKTRDADHVFSTNFNPGKIKSNSVYYYFSAFSAFLSSIKKTRNHLYFVFRACKTTCLNEWGNKAPPAGQF